MENQVSRKDLLRALAAGAVASLLPASVSSQPNRPAVTLDDLRSMAKVAGLEFSEEELKTALQEVSGLRREYEQIRPTVDDFGLFPSSIFRAPGDPEVQGKVVRVSVQTGRPRKPANPTDLAFMSVADLGHLLRTKQVTSLELTELFLDRLKEHGDTLTCVAGLMESSALEEARRADAEIAAGKIRGPIHGIPCGVKDLFATKGYPTQWGTAAFRGQRIDTDAAVVEKLRAAGAVIVAKLSLGALAMNDRWYGGMTKNPWNLSQGSSGSSAGSASAVAAALVPFAIGTETSGSIVSPSHQCRVTGLRTTFGSVSRFGAMALSWSMDKVGPICRTAEDTALVLTALIGRDERDAFTVNRGFQYRTPKNLKGLKIGVLGQPSGAYVSILKELGAGFGEFKAPASPAALGNIIGVEAATMFDAITRDGRLNQVVENEWPQIFRAARFVTAVEYVQAERARTKLIRDTTSAFESFDLVLAADRALPLIYSMNLVGLPQILVPFGANDRGEGVSFSLVGRPFREDQLIGAAHLVQQRTKHPLLRPESFAS